MSANGTGTGTYAYAWDAEGRHEEQGLGTRGLGLGGQKEIKNPKSKIGNGENAFGQRVEKKTGTAYTELVYDAFGSPIGSYDNSGWGAYYVPFNGRIFVKYQDSKTYFLHPNGLGSTTFVTDQTGATIQKTLYYPWGQLWASSALVKDNRFASMDQRDAETGNDPTLFRMYNPRLYRWLSPDPLAGNITNPQSLNRYAYALNDPCDLVDPLGLGPCSYNIKINSPKRVATTSVLPRRGLLCSE
ncbi:MAG: RHS repeat-associated core domain-containing protein [Acidobacteriia bacterium]|nr:RHS repeat-associated core domain-containing protein [Terriglobia bacterium]